MTWIQWCAVAFLVSCVSAPLIGEGLRYLHNRRTNQQFNQTLVGAAARARKAKIDSWVRAKEEKYLAETEAKFLANYADAITRDDVQGELEPDYAYRARMGLDRDDIPFSNDYADQQPQRPTPPRAA